MRHTIIGVLLAVTATIMFNGAASASTSTEAKFISRSAAEAAPSRTEYQVPVSVSVAQAILESGWGRSELAQDAYNFFGMKCAGGDHGPIATGCVQVETQECAKSKCHTVKAWFRSYNKRSDSFRDHGRHLSVSPRYAEAFKHSDDPNEFVRQIHKAGYATDPKYSEKLIGLMKEHNLYRYDKT